MLCDREGNRRCGVALAMRHRLVVYSPTPRKGRWAPHLRSILGHGPMYATIYLQKCYTSNQTNLAFSLSSPANCNFSSHSALRAIDLNIMLATSAAPIWFGHDFQKNRARPMRLKSTAHMNSSRNGCLLQFSVPHNRSIQNISYCGENAPILYTFFFIRHFYSASA